MRAGSHMGDIKPKLQKPDKREDVDRMTNVEQLGIPWGSQFEAADLDKLNLVASTLQAAVSSMASAEDPAHYTYNTGEVWQTRTAPLSAPTLKHCLTIRQGTMTVEELAADDTLAEEETEKYGEPLTERHRLMSQTELTKVLHKNSRGRTAYTSSPDISRDKQEQDADHYEQHGAAKNKKSATEYATNSVWRD